MEDHVEKFRQVDALAQNILRLTRNTLLVNLRFLDLALSQFQLTSYPGTLATDGQHLFYDTYYVLSMYKRERGRNVRDYLHIVLHCVFRHLFTSANIDRRCWDLACDIAVESAIEDLHLESAACNRAYAQEETLKELRSQVRLLTAEKLYRYFLDRQLSDDQMARLREPFLADDHRAWYLPVKSGQGAGGGSQSNGRTPETGTPGKQKSGRGGQGSRAQTPKSGTERRDKDLEQTWKEISERLQVDLETISRRHGTDAGNLVQELKAVNRETYDYADFLRRYMSLGEVTQVNQDEFDYIYYTYGLSLYGNMPLVEPLEYKEVRRIKEFVIAIDTSGSVSGDLVQRFVTKTYNILRQQENFFTKINLHIIQCDAEVQEDRKITSQKDFDNYLDTMQAVKAARGRIYFIPRDYMPKLALFEDFIALLEQHNQHKYADRLPLDANSMFVVDDEKQRSKMALAFYRTIQKDLAEYEKRATHLIQSGNQSPAIMDRMVLSIRELERKKIYYESILKQELHEVDEQYTSLRYLSDELQIRARSIQAQKRLAA